MLKITDYWAPWCGPCKRLNPILAEINDEFEDVTLVKVNVSTEEGKALAQEKRIRAIPYVEIEKDGELVEKFTGVMSKDKIVALLSKYV